MRRRIRAQDEARRGEAKVVREREKTAALGQKKRKTKREQWTAALVPQLRLRGWQRDKERKKERKRGPAKVLEGERAEERAEKKKNGGQMERERERRRLGERDD